MHPRFIVVALEPGHYLTDYAVIDTERNVCMCKCTSAGNAEMIGKVLNLQWRQRDGGSEPAALLVPEYATKDPV